MDSTLRQSQTVNSMSVVCKSYFLIIFPFILLTNLQKKKKDISRFKVIVIETKMKHNGRKYWKK